METAALVGSNGSIDWLCLPRFDSGACFAALLGDDGNGYWSIAPRSEISQTSRRYRRGTLVLETEFETADGVVRVVDCMPPREHHPAVVRIVEGVRGRVEMQSRLAPRFDYGWRVPRIQHSDGAAVAVAGPEALALRTPVALQDEQGIVSGRFLVSEGDRVPFRLVWSPSHEALPAPADPLADLDRTDRWWRDWSGRCAYQGKYRDALVRSLITLKALTYAPTGGIAAAVTTSLPEQLGGSRNWDYRFCWLRDAAFTLAALASLGYLDEARAWRDWLLRATEGDPSQIQIMYGLSGEALLPELELPWLSGYEGSTPVRIGNGASKQFQLDIYGEVVGAAYRALSSGVAVEGDVSGFPVVRSMLRLVEERWREPDKGIWEVRGPRRHFVYSKVMSWLAFDRALKLAEEWEVVDAPVDRWRRLRDEIHTQVCDRGFDHGSNTFVQHYGATGLDASLLLLPIVGFLPPADPRIQGTIAAVQDRLCSGPLVARYSTDEELDGLEGNEGAFLICSFWLVRALVLAGRRGEAEANFEQLLAFRNDVGLLSEEYDPEAGRLLGNFPQALSHIGLVNSVLALSQAEAAGRPPAGAQARVWRE